MLIRKKVFAVLLSLLLASMCFILCVSTHMLYSEVDNYLISAVVNGIYDTDNYCLFLNPILCGFVKIVSFLLPRSDALMLIVRLLLFLEVWVLFYLSLSTGNKYQRALNFSLILYITQIIGCWCANFTLQAAVFAFGGIVLLLLGRENKRKRYFFAGTFLITFGYMMRKEGVLLFVPFVLLEIILDSIVSKNPEKNIRWFGAIAVILVLLSGVQGITDASDKYANGAAYNKARAIVDYPSFSWEEVSEQAGNNGITRSEYEGAKNWRLADTQNITAEKLKTISEIGITTAKPVTVRGAVDVLKIMVGMLFSGNKKVTVLTAINVLLFFNILICCDDGGKKIEAFFAACGAVLIIFYFTYKGRAPERVWVPVHLGLMCVLFACSRNITDIHKIFSKFIYLLCICILCINFIGDAVFSGFLTPQLSINSRMNADESLLLELYEETDRIYIAGIDTPFVIDSTFRFQGKLPTEEYIHHIIPEGSWKYGQVYFNNLLERLNVSNPAEALLNRAHTYYLSNDAVPMLEYLKEHYGEDISVEQIGTSVDSFPVWQFSRKSKY